MANFLAGCIVIWVLYLAIRRAVNRISSPKKIASRQAADTQQELDTDAWEGSFWDASEPKPVNARLQLMYVDAQGAKSSRTVEVRQFGELPDTTLLIGKCLLRNATRTFRTDRIQQCVNDETGEIIDDVGAFLRGLYLQSPDRSMQTLQETELDVLKVLLFVGKADGQLRAPERHVIKETCIALTGDSRINDGAVRELLSSMDVPSRSAFNLAVGRLAKRASEHKGTVFTAATSIVATQKTVHPAEQEALDYIQEKFGIDTVKAA